LRTANEADSVARWENDFPAADFTRCQTIPFLLGPVLLQEIPTQNHHPEPRTRKARIAGLTKAIPKFQ